MDSRSTLELSGFQLINGRGAANGGCILARGEAQVSLVNVTLDNCVAMPGEQAPASETRGGAIAFDVGTHLVELSNTEFGANSTNEYEGRHCGQVNQVAWCAAPSTPPLPPPAAQR